jgi:hypothetical protein
VAESPKKFSNETVCEKSKSAKKLILFDCADEGGHFTAVVSKKSRAKFMPISL